ncbi:MAG: hypothetical protein IH624_10225 [Phycisphaerae bacterium]|nr:hypothetical protein [Phycisphaerae bacterium]
MSGECSRTSTPYRWVERPLYKDTDNPGAPPEGYNSLFPWDTELTQEYRLNGIRAGKLYPYVEDVTLYHCPADKNLNSPLPTYAAYRSYSIPGLMNSEDFTQRTGWPGYVPPYGWRTVALPDGGSMRLKLAEKRQDIVSPARKYVFVEEDGASANQPYNLGGFVLMLQGYWSWTDWPAPYHGNQSVLGFADGHVDVQRWTDLRTICIMKRQPLPGTTVLPSMIQPDNPDLDYMRRGYLACE